MKYFSAFQNNFAVIVQNPIGIYWSHHIDTSIWITVPQVWLFYFSGYLVLFVDNLFQKTCAVIEYYFVILNYLLIFYFLYNYSYKKSSVSDGYRWHMITSFSIKYFPSGTGANWSASASTACFFEAQWTIENPTAGRLTGKYNSYRERFNVGENCFSSSSLATTYKTAQKISPLNYSTCNVTVCTWISNLDLPSVTMKSVYCTGIRTYSVRDFEWPLKTTTIN